MQLNECILCISHVYQSAKHRINKPDNQYYRASANDLRQKLTVRQQYSTAISSTSHLAYELPGKQLQALLLLLAR
jgi:hypothetical protein